MTLGEMLAWHRGLCGKCTRTACCGEYLEIVREYTLPRRVWAGPVAASTMLSVREVIT